MKSNRINAGWLMLLALLSTINSPLSTLHAQGTAFTYQGRLNAGGNPVSGVYDFSFALFNAASGGAQQGATVTAPAVGVTNGLFTVVLDFGSQFGGSALWLDLAVRTNGAGSYTELSPRQPLTPTPYAITAENLDGALPASQISGVVPLAQLPAAVITNYAASASLSGLFAGSFGGSFYGNGGGLTGLNPTNVSAGTAAINISGNAATATTATTAANLTGNVSDPQIPANLARLNGTNNFTGTNTFAGVTAATNVNNVFAGTFLGNGGGLTNLNAAQFANSVLTNGATGVTLGGTFNGNATTATTANNFSGSLSGDVTGTQGATLVANVGGQSAANIASGASAANAATSANSASTIVKRDASGNLSASTIMANLTGNATTATTANNLSGSLSGDVTGTQGATLVANVGGQTAANVASGVSAANAATSANSASTIVKRDASGNLSASTITANLTGNATTATTANNFSGSLSGDVTGTQGATLVAKVGGQTAANVASATIAANAATSANTANTIVKRDAYGNFSAGTVLLSGNLFLPTLTTGVGIYTGGLPFIFGSEAGNFFAGFAAANLTMSGNDNTGVGCYTLYNNTSGHDNTASGDASLYSNTTGSWNTANGSLALDYNTSGSYNSAIGYAALSSNTSGSDNSAIGYNALCYNTSGGNNTANGYQALFHNTNGNYNTANGFDALYSNTSGLDNTASGYNALYSNTTGSFNIALGYMAGYFLMGDNNIDIGNEGLSSDNNIIRIGSGQTSAFIYAASLTVSGTLSAPDTIYADSGAQNTGALNPGLTFGGTGSSEGIASKRTSGTDQYGLDFYTQGTTRMTVNNNGNVGIGTTSPGSKFIVQADDASSYYDAKQVIIQGNTNPDQQLELGYKTSGNYGSIQAVQQYVGYKPLVLQPNGGNVGIGTTSPGYPLTMNSGAYCSVAGVWTSVSDRNAKEDFTAISPRAVLEKVSALPITEWKYKVEADGSKHLGPMAQDFHAAFGLNGADDKHIATVDEEGVALAAIQGLNQKVEEKEAEIQELKQSVAELKAMVEKLAGK